MMPEFLDTKTIYTIAHLIGVAFGAGGAFVSDGIFFSSIKDKRITETELRFIRLGSTFVWIGLAILYASGSLLFMLDPERYLDSTKFLAKITIVVVLTINGIVFHHVHMPMLHRKTKSGEELSISAEYRRESVLLYASGAVSVVSWTSALILGSLRTVPYSYGAIMLVYGALIAVGVSAALLYRRRFFTMK